MAFGKKKPIKSGSTDFTPEQIAAAIQMLQGASTKPPKGKVGRPPKVKVEGPEATQIDIQPSDMREGYVNIIFTDDAGEPAKPDEDTLKRLKLHGFDWAPSKRQWYGVAQMVPNDIAHYASFEIPEMPEYDVE